MRLVVMGVSGCGKSTVGAGLAAALGGPFLDGDDLHPPANLAKMAAGLALDDSDRAPWLMRVAEVLRETAPPVVIACSALRRRYRDAIRAAAGVPVRFVHLAGSRAVIAARLAGRQGHFMPAALLDSQFAALEPPAPEEAALSVDIDQPEGAIIAALLAAIPGRAGEG